MRRRALLATLAASSLAGCSVLEGSQETTQRVTAATCESPGGRRVELTGTGSVPPDANLTMTAAMIQEQLTADAPPRLRVRLTNKGEKRYLAIRDEQYCHLFDRQYGGSEPRGLWIYREQNAPTDRSDECWTREKSPKKTRTFLAVGCRRQMIGADETIATTYEVWDDYESPEYYPPDSYRFSAPVQVWESEDADEPDDMFDWWFDLRVIASET